jgi:hypothetical protein
VVGNTETIVDHANSTVVSKNTRTVVQGATGKRRILTRTVTRTTDPETGLSHTTVTVTSTFDDDDDDEGYNYDKKKRKNSQNNNNQDVCFGNNEFCDTCEKAKTYHNSNKKNAASSKCKHKDMNGCIDDNATEATAPMEDEDDDWFFCRPWLLSCV